MKHFLVLALLTLSLPAAAADRLHNYCFKVAGIARTVVINYDQGAPYTSLNRHILDAEGVSEQDLRTIIASVYDGQVDGLPMPDITVGTYNWCVKQHMVDMGPDNHGSYVAGSP